MINVTYRSRYVQLEKERSDLNDRLNIVSAQLQIKTDSLLEKDECLHNLESKLEKIKSASEKTILKLSQEADTLREGLEKLKEENQTILKTLEEKNKALEDVKEKNRAFEIREEKLRMEMKEKGNFFR